MTLLCHPNRAKFRLTLLALLMVTTLLTPSGAQAAERNGTVLFFPLAELQQLIVHPSPHSLTAFLSFSPPALRFAWPAWSTADRPQQGHTGYDNGPGVEAFHLPGPRPLWGD